MKIIVSTVATWLLATSVAFAQGAPVKVGFISTFSGGAAMVGNDMRNGFELALDHFDRKMAGRPVEAIYEDDQTKPEVGSQKTQKLIESNKVDFLTGFIWSNVLLASLKPAIDSKTFVISAVAGPSQLAGELCSPNVFLVSWQNNQLPQAMGTYLNQKGVKKLFLIAPNYAGGRDMLVGVKNTFKGELVGELYTRWPDQLDFSVELSKARAAQADGIFVFYPGASGVQFLRQYAQSGMKDLIPLYTVFTIDEMTLLLQKETALGVPGAQVWVNDLPGEPNKRFVSDFKKKYGTAPTYYAALSYDVAVLIKSAVDAVGGDLTRKEDMRKHMESTPLASLRGPLKLGNNHVPIQNVYLQTPYRAANGDVVLRTAATIAENDQDLFHDKCPMK